MTAGRVRVAALLLALIFMLAPLPPAHAETWWNAGHTSMGFRCSWALVHISTDFGSPAMWTKATADSSVNNWCDNQAFVAPKGTLAVAQTLMAWHQPVGLPGFWFECNRGNWFINDVPSHEWNTGFAWGAPPCGTRFFYARGYSTVHFLGRWHGFNQPIETGWIGI